MPSNAENVSKTKQTTFTPSTIFKWTGITMVPIIALFALAMQAYDMGYSVVSGQKGALTDFLKEQLDTKEDLLDTKAAEHKKVVEERNELKSRLEGARISQPSENSIRKKNNNDVEDVANIKINGFNEKETTYREARTAKPNVTSKETLENMGMAVARLEGLKAAVTPTAEVKSKVVYIYNGETKSLFDGRVFLSLIGTDFEVLPTRYLSVFSIGTPGDETKSISSAEVGFSVIHKGFEIRILSADVIGSKFYVARAVARAKD